MIEYVFRIFNEIVSYELFKEYLQTNFATFFTDSDIISAYLVFCILIFLLILTVILFLIYFIKYSKNLWFGRRRIR